MLSKSKQCFTLKGIETKYNSSSVTHLRLRKNDGASEIPFKLCSHSSSVLYFSCKKKPKNKLEITEENDIRTKLKLTASQNLFFSYIAYDDFVYSENKTIRIVFVHINSVQPRVLERKQNFVPVRNGTTSSVLY